MLKQLFDRTTNTFAIFLVFFVIISITASLVSAQSPVLKNVTHQKTSWVATPPPTGEIYHLYSPSEVHKILKANQNLTKMFKAEPPGADAIVIVRVGPTAWADLSTFSAQYEPSKSLL
jgi:hypothetical protein